MNPQKSIGLAFTDRYSGQVIEWGRQLPILARSVGSSPCSDTSGVEGEADMRDSWTDAFDPTRKSSVQRCSQYNV